MLTDTIVLEVEESRYGIASRIKAHYWVKISPRNQLNEEKCTIDEKKSLSIKEVGCNGHFDSETLTA